MTDHQPPAIEQPAPRDAEEAAFRAEMRKWMRHVTDDLSDLKKAVDYLLRADRLDSGR